LTSQRGPFISGIVACLFLFIHQYVQLKNKKALISGLLSVIAISIITLIFVPKRILIPRLSALTYIFDQSEVKTKIYGDSIPIEAARYNQNLRVQHAKLALNVISKNPFGNSCITEQEFLINKIFPPGHAHNMFLQQFRERGWAWGAFHLVMWILAALGFWRSQNTKASILFAGITSVIISGLFDHPWFVINQSLILGIYLILGLDLYFKKTNKHHV
jgi:hypothetical protein